jgi:cobalamin biosynthetic protein CobC
MSDSSPGLPLHGGDLADAERRFGRPAQGWLDLSTGINPWPYPIPVAEAGAHARLPDQAAMDRLFQAAAGCYGVRAEQVAAGAGSQAFIQWLPFLLPPDRVAILGPTYGPHEQAWRAAGHAIVPVRDLGGLGACRHAVLVNPNNPDGRSFEPRAILEATAALRRSGGLVLVDEAFADCTPENTLAPHLEHGIVILRSFGKFFGLAGLRLGFALAMPDLAERLRAAIGPWPVGGLAIAAGTAALSDRAWIAATRRRLADASGRLDACLAEGGLAPVGGTALFRLAAHPDAGALWERLGRQGILTRAFDYAPAWLRIGLPPDEEGLARLADALAQGSSGVRSSKVR